MSTKTPKNIEDQEIDLSQISNRISGFFKNINTSLFKIIQFMLRKKWIIGALLFIGFAAGFYLDAFQKTYNHEVIVAPNFGSTDYMYSKISLISSKIQENDTVYLKSIGINKSNKIQNIEIQPIVDVYKFINGSEQNFEFLKLLSEDAVLSKVITESLTSKNYPYHLLTITSATKSVNNSMIEPILKYLNNNDFFQKTQVINLENIQNKIKGNENQIAQIDTLLHQYSTSANKTKGGNLVYYNENTQVNELLKTKDALIKEKGTLRTDLINVDKTIKDISIITNIKNTNSINGKMKLIIPFLFISLYLLVHFFIAFYKKQSLLAQKN